MRTSVCVYSASSTKVPEQYNVAARSLGRILAQSSIRLINGAGRMGLMAECANACLDAGGKVTGVIPHFMVEQGWHHNGLTELIETDTMHDRKETMAKMAEGIIALPGGIGTLEELMEIITWKQLSLFLHPIIILNTGGYYDPLLEMLQRTLDEQFMGSIYAHLWLVASTPEEAVQLLLSTPDWAADIRKYAAL
ncbi:MAG: TIGR00730 family Rossman fold protein [Bacteroidaceae bacterium]